MLVRMKNGQAENLTRQRAETLIRLGLATKYVPLTKEQAILQAENSSGVSACAAVELAIYEPKHERAVIPYAQTARSRR